jgi:hypothetical protein
METLVDLAKQGIQNLIANCAKVDRGEKVVLLSDQSTVEPGAATLVKDAIEERRARADIIWADATARSARSGLTTGIQPLLGEQVEMLLSADKVISSISAELLLKQLRPGVRPPLVIVNLFHTLEDLASEHARFPWDLARAIYEVMEHETFPVGSQWKITSPSGTELVGTVGDASSRARYLDERRSEHIRCFYSHAYVPVASAHAEGTLVVDYTGGAMREPAYDPPHLFIERNKIAHIKGGRHRRKWVDEYRSALERQVERFGESALILDSWHGGANPAAVPIPEFTGTASPKVMHFHVGRTTGRSGDYASANIGLFTLEVDGRRIIEAGRLLILDQLKTKEAVDTVF